MPASAAKIARLWMIKKAENLPPDVERYVEEGKDSGMDEGKAWAIAWSRYCKYKNPGSDHCKMAPGEYFKGRAARKLRGSSEPSLGTLRVEWEFNSSLERVYTITDVFLPGEILGGIAWDKDSSTWEVWAYLDANQEHKKPLGKFTASDPREGVETALLTFSRSQR